MRALQHRFWFFTILYALSFYSLISLKKTQATPTSFQLPGEHFNWSAIAPRRQSSEGYGEKYTFNAELNGPDGEKGELYLSLMISNLGAGDHKMTSKGRLTYQDQTIKWKQNLSAKKWKSKAQPLFIQAGQVTVSEEHGALVLTLKHDKLDFKISMTELAHNWQPRGGGLKFGTHFTKIQTIPLTSVQGDLSYKGDLTKEIHVTGKGWGSHSASDLGPYEQNLWSSKIQAIDLSRDETLYMRSMKITQDYGSQEISYVIMTQKDQLIFEGTGFTTKILDRFIDQKKHDYVVPLAFEIDVPHANTPGVQLKGGFKVIKRTRRRDPIAHLSWSKKLIVERFSKPMEYAYDLSYNLTLNGSSKQTFQGKARYEVFHFNQK